ncbi:hypothetical protein HK096_005459, partial [Nowakowskiella sp. JEL0078]
MPTTHPDNLFNFTPHDSIRSHMLHIWRNNNNNYTPPDPASTTPQLLQGLLDPPISATSCLFCLIRNHHCSGRPCTPCRKAGIICLPPPFRNIVQPYTPRVPTVLKLLHHSIRERDKVGKRTRPSTVTTVQRMRNRCEDIGWRRKIMASRAWEREWMNTSVERRGQKRMQIELKDLNLPVEAKLKKTRILGDDEEAWRRWLVDYVSDHERQLFDIPRAKVFSLDVSNRSFEIVAKLRRSFEKIKMLELRNVFGDDVRNDNQYKSDDSDDEDGYYGFSTLRFVYDRNEFNLERRTKLKDVFKQKLIDRGLYSVHPNDPPDLKFPKEDIDDIIPDETLEAQGLSCLIDNVTDKVPSFERSRLALPNQGLLKSIIESASHLYTNEYRDPDAYRNLNSGWQDGMLYSMDGTSLLATGILIQEYIRHLICNGQ